MISAPANGKPANTGARNGWLGIFRPAPAAPVTLTDPAEIAAKYRRWRTRVLILSISGYALFYFVRKNLGVAMPYQGRPAPVSDTARGHLRCVQVPERFSGRPRERRRFMATALPASALLNLWFGFSSVVVAFGVIWMLNGWFQGMGFPPCARLTANLFPRNSSPPDSPSGISSTTSAASGLSCCAGFL